MHSHKSCILWEEDDLLVWRAQDLMHSKDFLVFALVLALCRTKGAGKNVGTQHTGPRGGSGEGGQREHHVGCSGCLALSA